MARAINDTTMIATSHNLPHPRRWRRIATAATALGLACALSLSGGVAVTAQGVQLDTPSPTPTPPGVTTPANQLAQTQLTAVADAGGSFDPGAQLTLTARLAHSGSGSISNGTLAVKIESAALTSTAAIETWLTDGTSTAGAVELIRTQIDGLSGDATRDTTLVVPASQAPLPTLAPGVYPISVELTTPEGTVTDRTTITINANDDPLLSLVIPITGTPGSRGLLDAETLASLTEADGYLGIALKAAQSSNAVLAVDPAVLAAIRVLGTAAPPVVQSWLTEFNKLPNERFVLSFADADSATLVAAGHADLAPTTLNRYLDSAGDDNGTPSPTPGVSTPGTASPTPTTAPLPTTEELLFVANGITDIVWPATGQATQELANWSAEQAATLLLSSDQVGTADPHVSLADNGADALVYNAELSTLVSMAAAAKDDVVRNDNLSQAIAKAAVTTSNRQLVVWDRATELQIKSAQEVVGALSAASAGRLSGLGPLRTQPATSAALNAALPDDVRVDKLTDLLQNEAPLARMASVLTDPTLLTGAERAEVLQLFSNSWIDDDAWTTAVREHEDSAAETLDAIRIEPLSTIQFLSSGSSIPLRIRNDLPFTANLTLTAVSDDFRLTVESPMSVQAQAGAVTKVMVPVTAGLGNGEVSVRFAIASPDNSWNGNSILTDVNVRAEWEKWGIVALASLMALLVVFGTIRTVRKRKRAKAEAEGEHAADAEPSSKAKAKADAVEPGADAGSAPEADANSAPEADSEGQTDG